MAERYTIEEVVRIVEEYGTARYNEGVHDALRRPQAASGAHATAKDRLADLRFMLAYGIKPPGVPPSADLRALLDEVRQCFTRDDDLPNDLLPRIDAALDGVRVGGEAQP